MYEKRERVIAQKNFIQNGVDIYILLYEDGKRYQVTNMEVDEMPNGHEPYSPQTFLTNDDAQALFDDLWNSGFRPKKPDETSAKDAHITDLRMMLFHQLGITK